MDITGLTLQEIGEKIKKFLPSYLQSDFQFQENYQLQFDEIKHHVPKKYHKFFNNDDKINSTSGSVEVIKIEYDYNLILVSNEDFTEALFLFLQKENKETGEVETELLTSFLLAEIDDNLIINQLNNYQNILIGIKDFVEENKDKLHDNNTVEELKRRLLGLILQTTILLEAFY